MYVEPSQNYYFTSPPDFHSVIYRVSDVQYPETNRTCATVTSSKLRHRHKLQSRLLMKKNLRVGDVFKHSFQGTKQTNIPGGVPREEQGPFAFEYHSKMHSTLDAQEFRESEMPFTNQGGVKVHNHNQYKAHGYRSRLHMEEEDSRGLFGGLLIDQEHSQSKTSRSQLYWKDGDDSKYPFPPRRQTNVSGDESKREQDPPTFQNYSKLRSMQDGREMRKSEMIFAKNVSQLEEHHHIQSTVRIHGPRHYLQQDSIELFDGLQADQVHSPSEDNHGQLYWRDLDSLHYTEPGGSGSSSSEPYGVRSVQRTQWPEDGGSRRGSVAVDRRKSTCLLYLQADHLFYRRLGGEEACIDAMTRHVQRVNSIYRNTG